MQNNVLVQHPGSNRLVIAYGDLPEEVFPGARELLEAYEQIRDLADQAVLTAKTGGRTFDEILIPSEPLTDCKFSGVKRY